MNIFEQYGIKEVADVCLYSIELDENDDEIYVPVLYLDTLKVSTVEETAEQTSARGGLGNPELIIWDYGKEITVNLEDALYSPASQGMAWGGKLGTKHFTLKGTLTRGNAPETEIPVDIIVKNLKNFKVEQEKGYYCWNVELNVISANNYSFVIKEVPIFYNIIENKWTLSIVFNSLYPDVLMGDVNQDGRVDKDDLDKLSKYSLNPEGHPLSKKGAIAADVCDPFVDFSSISSEVINYVPEGLNARDQTTLGSYIWGTINKSVLENSDHWYLTAEEKNVTPPQEVIYQIDHALQNVNFLDRMEKCIATQTFCIDTITNTKHGNYRYLQEYSQCELTVFIDPRTMQPYEPNTDTFTRKNGNMITGQLRIIKQHEIYYKWTRSKAIDNMSLGHQIIVDAIHFPGTYRLVGETYSRSRKTGKDQRYQFEIPLCKMGTENNLTLQADGDPTTFNMTLKVLRREDGVMMKLTQFDVAPAKYDGYTSDSTVVVPGDEVVPENPSIGVE